MSIRTTFSRDDTIAAIERAADWLEAHPDRHITGTYSRDVFDRVCEPSDDLAHCFCAVGRVIHELGDETMHWDEGRVFDVLVRHHLNGVTNSSEIATLNDKKGRILKRSGRRKAIKRLREVVKEAKQA